MDSLNPWSPSVNAPPKGSNSDEYFLEHSLVFAESLKDLKNIRGQLYSAAEYFESAYMNHEHKQLVEDTLKDYIGRALISTVDHLGSIASRVQCFLDDKSNEISAATLRFSGIQQKVRTFTEIMGRYELVQWSVIETPKHYKRYTIPVSDASIITRYSSIPPNSCILSPQDDMHQNKQPDDSFSKAFRENFEKPNQQLSRRGNSRSHSTQPPTIPLTFSFMRLASTKGGKRAVSPLSFPFRRSGSITNRSTSPGSSSSINNKRWPSEPRRTGTALMNPERSQRKEMELYSRKSKHLFKALFTIHPLRKEGVPHKFRDGY